MSISIWRGAATEWMRPAACGGANDMKFAATKVKLIRAQGECLGIRSRWRTWQAAKSFGELQMSIDPEISETAFVVSESLSVSVILFSVSVASLPLWWDSFMSGFPIQPIWSKRHRHSRMIINIFINMTTFPLRFKVQTRDETRLYCTQHG